MSQNSDVLKAITDNIEKVIVGKRSAIELSIITLISGGHLLIEDVPGVGKTSLVSALAKSINASFKRLQFTPDVLPSDIIGFTIYNRKTEEFEYIKGAVNCNFLLADEINRTSPKTQSSLLEVMEDGHMSIDGVTHELPKPFMVMATQNPIEYLGTYPLPEAQLDRFLMKISIGYPSQQNEVDILIKQKQNNPMNSLKAVASISDIINIQREVREVFIESTLLSYIVRISNLTRNNKDIVLGVSPRGSLAMSRAAQAKAYYNGRNFVIPEDIKEISIPVLSHRIMLSQEARIKKTNASDIIKQIVNDTSIGM